MNIFYTDECPYQCAKNLDNRRVYKMTLETIQLFGYALYNLNAPEKDFPHKKDGLPFAINKAHLKHPCTVWLQQTRGNYEWLQKHLHGLTMEYEHRRGKVPEHYLENYQRILHASRYWPDGVKTPHVNCSQHSVEGEVILSYRLTMIKKWEEAINSGNSRKKITFGTRGAPGWYNFLKTHAAWE